METCTMLTGNPPETCHLCANPLTGRRTRWCSDACETTYWRNHDWRFARPVAAARALVCVDGEWAYRCEGCGTPTLAPEVNHRTPCLGRHGRTGCWHHLDGLEVLCHGCHVRVTAAQRASGWRSAVAASGALVEWRQEELFDEQLTLV